MVDTGEFDYTADVRGTLAASRHLAGARDAGIRLITPARAEHVLAIGLALLVFVVHDLGYILRTPYWLDEAWVAATTRFSVLDLPSTTASTPIGWSALVRAFSVGGGQSARLIPLAFAAGAVVVAYWYVRRLPWPRPELAVGAGTLAAVGVLLAPAMLARNDLKQYTADACLALLTLSLTSMVERRWSRSGLALLSASIWCGMLFSHTVAFVGATAFIALCLLQLARRAWSRLIESLVAALCTAALMLVVYELFDARAVDPSSTAVVHRYFPPVHQGWHATLHFLRFRFDTVHSYFGLGPIWLAGALFAVGVGTLFRLGRPATALTMLLIWPFMFGVSAAHKYPFLDERRNTFLFVITTVGAAIGVAGIAGVLHRWLTGTVSLAAAAGAVLAIAIVAWPNARSHTIPQQDTRDQGRFIAENAASNDVILVSMPSSFGFAYYWRQDKPSRRPSSANTQGYIAYFPTDRRVIVADDRTADAVAGALDQAISRAHELGTHQVWLVRTHVDTVEAQAWQRSLRAHGVTAAVVSPSGLALIRLA